MSMFFVNVDNQSVEFDINNRGWRRIYNLARMYGWNPRGTQSIDQEWDPMNYFTNDGQKVTTEDALEFGKAIELAIPDLKQKDPENDPEKLFGAFWEIEMHLRMGKVIMDGIKDPAFIFFNTDWTKKLTELADFCRQGAFLIY